jgi:hypothetical protein
MTEKKRILIILEMIRCARLCDEVGEELIKSDATIEQAESKIQSLVEEYNQKISHYTKDPDLDFFTSGNVKFSDIETFIFSLTGMHLSSVYGELTFTTRNTLNFIDVYREGSNFVFSDATFCKRYTGPGEHIGTVIPKRLSVEMYKNFTAPQGNNYTSMLTHKGYLSMYIDSSYASGKTLKEFQDKYRTEVVDCIGQIFEGNALAIHSEYNEVIMQKMGKGDLIPAHSDSNVNDNYLFNTLSHGADRGTERELVFGQRTEDSLFYFLKSTSLKQSEEYYKQSEYTPDFTVHPTKDTLIFINSFNPLFVHEVKELTNDSSVYTIVSNIRI